MSDQTLCGDNSRKVANPGSGKTVLTEKEACQIVGRIFDKGSDAKTLSCYLSMQPAFVIDHCSLLRSAEEWNYTEIYSFPVTNRGLVLDASGNLYGTTFIWG
jgi:hypothetical protein